MNNAPIDGATTSGTSADAGREAEEAASRYMNELTARLLGGEVPEVSSEPVAAAAPAADPAPVPGAVSTSPAPPTSAEPSTEELDSTTAASLEKFMASLKEHLQLAPDASATGGTAAATAGPAAPAPAIPAVPPPARHERVHQWTHEERQARVREAVREFLAQERDGVPTGTRRILTTVRCVHASVAQKSYGSEKRFLCPPPAVQVRGALRHQHAAPSLFMQVQGEDGESFSGEQLALLDEEQHARFTELHVTGTGKAKSFRLQLHLLVPRDAQNDANEFPKRIRLAHGMEAAAAAPAAAAASWATLDSAPIGIISKPSKKTAKARNASAHIGTQSNVALFNRINSQTYRTKYLCSHQGRLSAQSRNWTAFRLVLLARPAAARSELDEGALTYGSTVVLVDTESGASTDPLVVCKVDRGRVIPPLGGAAAANAGEEAAEENSAYGTVSQMQKVALMRYVPPPATTAAEAAAASRFEVYASMPRTYLSAGTPTVEPGSTPLSLGDDAHTLPLSFAAPHTAHVPLEHGHGLQLVDEVEDVSCWTLVGISHFEYSFIDVDTLDTHGSMVPAGGVPLTPFPLVTTMPFYDVHTHKLATSVVSFYATRGVDMPPEPLEVWLGPLGPLPLAVQPSPERVDEVEIAVQLPPLRQMLETQRTGGESVWQCTLPLLFVRPLDGATYHSGRQLVCQDLVAVVRAAGDLGAANALQKLHVGLGEPAGAHEVPGGGAWTLRVI